jgi:acetylglutamate kinase
VPTHAGRTFVVKAGGELFDDRAASRAFMAQLPVLRDAGLRVVLVHGGGAQLTALAAALGIETRKVDGRRVTDERAIDVAAMVLNGLVNTRILACCRELGIDAVGLSGVDSRLVRAHRRPPVRVEGRAEAVDYGLVGDIDSVDAGVLRVLLDSGRLPVVSPLCASDAGELLNVNADTVATAIAVALGADELVLCTGAPGILEDVNDQASLVSCIDLEGLARLRARGSFADGMLPKASAVETAIRGGVRRVHLVSYRRPDGLLDEVFTEEGSGTLIVADVAAHGRRGARSGAA